MKQRDKRLVRINQMLDLIRKEPMNRLQLKDGMYMHQATIDDYITDLYEQELIHIEYYVKTNGLPTPYWKAGKDQEGKIDRKKAVIIKARQVVKKPRVYNRTFKPKRDIAASWF